LPTRTAPVKGPNRRARGPLFPRLETSFFSQWVFLPLVSFLSLSSPLTLFSYTCPQEYPRPLTLDPPPTFSFFGSDPHSRRCRIPPDGAVSPSFSRPFWSRRTSHTPPSLRGWICRRSLRSQSLEFFSVNISPTTVLLCPQPGDTLLDPRPASPISSYEACGSHLGVIFLTLSFFQGDSSRFLCTKRHRSSAGSVVLRSPVDPSSYKKFSFTVTFLPFHRPIDGSIWVSSPYVRVVPIPLSTGIFPSTPFFSNARRPDRNGVCWAAVGTPLLPPRRKCLFFPLFGRRSVSFLESLVSFFPPTCTTQTVVNRST